MKKYLSLLLLSTFILFIFPVTSNCQTIIDGSCTVIFAIQDPYCVPLLNMTYDFQVGTRFFGSISGLSCSEINKLKNEIYETYLTVKTGSNNLYDALNSRIIKTQESLSNIEYVLEQNQRSLTDDEWNVVLSTFLVYMSGVELGYVIATSGLLTGGAAVGIVGVSAGLYLIYKGCTGHTDRLFAIRHIKKSVYLHRDLIENDKSKLNSSIPLNYTDAIKTFNGLCNIVRNNCMPCTGPPESPSSLHFYK
ncbi:hypothetical protein [Desulfatitalea alkaliphila]|uniref:Uncharacterized protein n=1 Tax=Desulfatitalea alkaliphila TaxID=2929485 RepID=A0AA41R8Y6_9BACT|nr:hypothetical protein [Desulfatitalea alkaliphila]MCJ8503186.1 hypothetical protein [Desulfatitalea alkaliphila]